MWIRLVPCIDLKLRDMHGEFGLSFTYLRAWRGKEAALNNLRGDDTQSYQGNFIVIMPNYYVIILLMVDNLLIMTLTCNICIGRLTVLHSWDEMVKKKNPRSNIHIKTDG